MTLEELKEFSLQTMVKLKYNNRSKAYIEGQMAGLFKMWKKLNVFTDQEYDKYLDTFCEVLDEI